MKSMKKLVALAVVLGLACLAAIGTTYAWFTASQNARAEGLELTATVPNNLQISTDDVTWGTSAVLTSGVTEMIPVSSVRGYDDSFYYIQSVAGNGGVLDANSSFTAVKLTETTNGDAAYYIDIPIYLKLTDATASVNIEISSAQFISTTSGASNLSNAYRIAVFDAAGGSPTEDNQVYFGGNSLDTREVHPLNEVSALYTGTSKIESTPFNVSNSVAKQLTIRIWLEGQDPNCINTNATDSVKLAIEFASATAS